MKTIMVADKATGLATYRGNCPSDGLISEGIIDRMALEINSNDFIWARILSKYSLEEAKEMFEKYAASKGVSIRWMTNEEYLSYYKGFMENPNNVCKCHECPGNYGYDGEHPCGQQNCWVSLHCGEEV